MCSWFFFFFFFIQFNVPFKIISLIETSQSIGGQTGVPRENHLTHPQAELVHGSTSGTNGTWINVQGSANGTIGKIMHGSITEWFNYRTVVSQFFGQLTPQSVEESGCNSNSSKLLWLSLLPTPN